LKFLRTGLLAAKVALASAASATAQTQPPGGTADPPVIELPTIEIIGTSPLLGTGIDRDKVPSATHSFSAPDLRREGTPDLTSGLRDRLAGVTINETQNNPFQPDVQHRGFVASPLNGTPQGLAVYQNGVRINEVFGDTVNWDALPDRAINRLNVAGSNPVFGLNALGGAIALEMKNGFTFQGGEFEVSGGSFGRRSLEGEYGVKAGNFAAYIAATGLNEEGWRDFSPSQRRNIYADLGAQFGGERRGEVHLLFTGAVNRLTGNGTTPVQLLAMRRQSIFTYPDRTVNKIAMLSLNGTYELGETLSLQAVAYYRRLRQQTLNGDIFEAEACDAKESPGNLCVEDDDGPALFNQLGTPIADFLSGVIPGAFNRTFTSSTGLGGSLQLTETARLFDRSNHLVVGVSYDHGNAGFSANSEIGTLTQDRTVAGSGLIVTSADGTVAPVEVKSENNYYGFYATDTLDLTDSLALTLGGRYNIAQIRLSDQIGTSLNGAHNFSRFNPAAGATYKIATGVTAYAGYAEGNRAPTPAELSCADPARPCTLANFFVSDPPLKQVVTHTYEAGLRGGFDPFGAGRVTWNAGLFRTDSDDDIINVASSIQGRGFFQNGGTTRRQGIEAGAAYRGEGWSAYVDYAFVDATFRDALTLNSPSNPSAAPDGTIAVRPGDHLPSIPNHRLRVGADYQIVPKWTVGATLIYTGSQYLRGDEANLAAPIPNYWVVNLNTKYRIAPNFEVFGAVQNLFDKKYATFGTFSEVTGLAFGGTTLTDPLSLSLGPPLAVYAGVRLRF
jgi:outer membrane receptor protein involved in Fe transport